MRSVRADHQREQRMKCHGRWKGRRAGLWERETGKSESSGELSR